MVHETNGKPTLTFRWLLQYTARCLLPILLRQGVCTDPLSKNANAYTQCSATKPIGQMKMVLPLGSHFCSSMLCASCLRKSHDRLLLKRTSRKQKMHSQLKGVPITEKDVQRCSIIEHMPSHHCLVLKCKASATASLSCGTRHSRQLFNGVGRLFAFQDVLVMY